MDSSDSTASSINSLRYDGPVENMLGGPVSHTRSATQEYADDVDINRTLSNNYLNIDEINKSILEDKSMKTGNGGPPLRYGFWDAEMAYLRKTIVITYVRNCVLLGLLCFTILLVYWGASFNREKYAYKVSILAVIQDEVEYDNENQVVASLNQNFTGIIHDTLQSGQLQGTWHVYNQSAFIDKYHLPNASQIDQKVLELIHSENYWLAVDFKQNITSTVVDSLTNTNASDLFNSTAFINVYFESGRDPTNLRSAILPFMQKFEAILTPILNKQFLQQMVFPMLENNNLIPANSSYLTYNAKAIAASDYSFNYIDNRPFNDAVVLSPLQVGAIYVLIMTILQYALWGKVHGMVSQKLKIPQLIIYRITVSVSTLFILSLFFCTISAVYQVDFTPAFGKGGFVVYWISTWLVMIALAGANENMVGLIIAYDAAFLSFWIIVFIILNISVSFFPFALNSDFYRFGYFMPVHQAVDIYKVIFLNLSKHKMGRNYGILVAWVAINYALLPFFMKVSGEKMRKTAEQQMAAAIERAKELGEI